MVEQETEVLNEREAAALLKVSTRTLYELRRRGVVPFKQVGKQIRYLRSHLIAWLAGGESHAAAV